MCRNYKTGVVSLIFIAYKPRLSEASWRSGYAEDCKSLHPSSILGEASSSLKMYQVKPIRRAKPGQRCNSQRPSLIVVIRLNLRIKAESIDKIIKPNGNIHIPRIGKKLKMPPITNPMPKSARKMGWAGTRTLKPANLICRVMLSPKTPYIRSLMQIAAYRRK